MSTEPLHELDTDPLGESDLLLELVRALVDAPAEVRVEEHGNDSELAVFLIHVAPEDRGKVIGKQGRIIESLRVIFGAMLAVDRRRVTIEVADSRRAPTPTASSGRRFDRRRGALAAA